MTMSLGQSSSRIFVWDVFLLTQLSEKQDVIFNISSDIIVFRHSELNGTVTMDTSAVFIYEALPGGVNVLLFPENKT